jgi:DNA-binding SARP family transcriptional activator
MKALEVLAYLAVAGERGAHREQVIEAVWPDRDPDKGRMLLRAALSEIRRRLEPERQTGEPSRFVASSGDHLQLEARVDLADARAAANGRPAGALERFRGELLEDLPYAEWAFEERRIVGTLRAHLADRVARDDHASSESRIAALELLLTDEPWRVDLYDQLRAAHLAAGNEAAARSVERRHREAAHRRE